MGDFMHIMFPY